MKISVRHLFALLALGAFVFVGLSIGPLRNPDEGRYAATAYAMAFGLGDQSPDWLVPHFNTLTRLNKPPLAYWLAASSFQIFGPSEWSARLPAALGSLVVLLTLFAWGAKVWGPRVGLAAALVWATSLFPAIMGRTINTDMLLCAAMFVAAFGLFWSVEERKFIWGIVAGLGFGFALLSKGPVGVALPLGALVFYLLAARKLKSVPWRELGISLGIALLVGLPWFLLVERERPGFLANFIFAENLGRFAGDATFHLKRPVWIYAAVILGGSLLWAPFLLPALARWREPDAVATRTRLFCGVWAAFIVVFFTLSGTRLESYVLPAMPALALLIGATLAQWPRLSLRLRRASLALVVSLNLVLAIVLLVLFAPGGALDQKLVAREFIWPLALGLVGVLLGGSALVLLASYFANTRNLLLAHGATSALTIVSLLFGIGAWAKYDDTTAIYHAAAPFLKPEDKVASRIFAPTAIFYARRPVTFFGFRNTSGLREEEYQNSPYFVTDTSDQAVKDWFAAQTGRAFLLVEAPESAPADLYFWGRNNDYSLFANRPRPAEFALEFVAPREKKRLPIDLEEWQSRRRSAR